MSAGASAVRARPLSRRVAAGVVTRHEAQQVLISDRCLCGAEKRPKKAFCTNCYGLLPAGLRNRLYLGIGNGFEQAYAGSVVELERIHG
ncbi:MAG: hypothetical protein EPO02_12895 [Nitrospirae bacterium]|nr:MAG: hypothetical protein EPO02_12895 [Nitrospirota bacterium]